MRRPVVILPVVVVCKDAPAIPTAQSVLAAEASDKCPFCSRPLLEHTNLLPMAERGVDRW